MADEKITTSQLPAPDSPDFDEQLRLEMEKIQNEVSMLMSDLSSEQIAQLEDVYYLYICWGDFHLTITKPYFDEQLPPTVIPPAVDKKTKQLEDVYPIVDYGNRFSTSPGEELAIGGRATGKLLNTVEKIISLAIARAKQGSSDPVPEIRVAFLGLDIAQRKAYKLCMDAVENVLVTNFEPGEWGERFLKSTKELLDRGYPPIKPNKF